MFSYNTIVVLGVLVRVGTSVYAAKEFSNTTIIKENNEQEIARLFVKAAVGSSVVTIVATLGYYSAKCAIQ